MAAIRSPWGAGTTSVMSATGTQAITINDQDTVIDGATTQATGNRTLDLTIDSQIKVGATLIIVNKTAAAETLTYGTGITAPVIIGVAGKTTSQGFKYDGTNFLPTGEQQQADAPAANSFAMTATGAQAVTITSQETIIDGVTVEATAARTINLTINAAVQAGARIHVRSKTNAAELLTFGTLMTAPKIRGVAGKTYAQSFTFDGTDFFADGRPVLEDPQGTAGGVFTMSATGAQAVTISDQFTLIDGVTTEATGNRTINLTIDATVIAGARLQVRNKSNGTETLTYGTLITGAVITGAAGKTDTQSFTFDGTDFNPDGAEIQID